VRALVILVAALAGCAHHNWEDPGDRWRRVTSEHFLVHTDSSRDEYAPVIDRLEDVHQALSTTFFKGVTPPRSEVLLFANERDFKAVVPPDISGYYVRGLGKNGGGVLSFSTQAEDFDVVASIAAHELAHDFLNTLSPRLPPWLHEGFAKYVGAIQLSDDMVVFDMQDIHGGYVYFADPVPLAQLFAARDADFHSSASSAHYMTSWILMRQLFGNAGAGGGRAERFRTLVDKVAAANSPAAQAAAVSETFSNTIEELDRRIHAFHSAVYHGIGQAPSRSTVAVTLHRSARPPLKDEPDDPALIRDYCAALRSMR
jgi:hypothetical protein